MPVRSRLTLMALALCAIAVGALAQPVIAPATQPAAPRTDPHVSPPQSYSGQWFTTPDRCTYSRTQAPGYRVRWILVLNPHHVGTPPAHRGCPGML
ncbi:hypothetical protein LVO79_07350 [Roseivivax marinus]|uniref:hypothetical protein n=1 Tax=Roseivivax marinus TaxID=1379903 RepID=UPI001F0394F0|nr:hypothetical protein [Roseivivax marinus]UMA66249.1 hypothetical protein LVO79_07350 [Roseivivax marinus]